MKPKSKLIGLSLLLIISTAAFSRQSQDSTRVPNAPAQWGNQPATPRKMLQKFEEAAIKYQADGPYPRGVLHDIAYPHNDAEYAALDGYAVLLITALAQEQGELPLKRVYVLIDDQEIQLKPIKVVLSQVATKSNAVKVFGAFRADALYLLPLYLRLRTTDLMVDFAKNKIASKAGIFGGEVPPYVGKLTVRVPTGVGPTDKVLGGFIKREFPSFFQK